MTTDPLLALGEHPFLLVLEQLPPTQLCTLQRVSRTWHAFLSQHTGLWSGVLRRAGVDLDEWEQTLFESGERERLTAWAEEKRQAALAEAIELLGDIRISTPVPAFQDEEDDVEPLILGSEYDYEYMPDPKPEEFLPQHYPSTAAGYRAAYKSHLQLKAAWDKRACYETLVNTPAFRLRRIYVDGPFLFAFSKAWLGAVPEDREATEDLHVLDKYSGKKLLTVPGLTRHQAHAVGGGYVLTSANEQDSEDDHEDRERDTPPGPVGLVSVFRRRVAHDRAVELAELYDRPRPKAFRTDLPLEFVANIDALATCVAFTVKLVGGEAVACGVSASEVVLVWLENALRVERWRHDVPLQCSGARFAIRAVELDERCVVLVTDLQAHVYTRTGTHVANFPDLDPRAKTCDLLCPITWAWPYEVAHARKAKVSPYDPGPRAPPEFHPAETTQRGFVAYRPNSRKYRETASRITRSASRGGDHLAAMFRGAIMDKIDLVVWGERGVVLVVQDFRSLFRDLAIIDEKDRVDRISERTVAVVEPDHIDSLVARDGRILAARASGTMWSLDLTTLPRLPSELPPLPLPELPSTHIVLHDLTNTPANRAVWAGSYTNYDISCLSRMSARASVALDARAAYMLDWDKGFPGGASEEYETLFDGEREGEWPWPTRPAFGHVKMWVYRPHASVLWTEHSRCLGHAMGGEGLCGCGRRHGDDDWPTDDNDDDDDAQAVGDAAANEEDDNDDAAANEEDDNDDTDDDDGEGSEEAGEEVQEQEHDDGESSRNDSDGGPDGLDGVDTPLTGAMGP